MKPSDEESGLLNAGRRAIHHLRSDGKNETYPDGEGLLTEEEGASKGLLVEVRPPAWEEEDGERSCQGDTRFVLLNSFFLSLFCVLSIHRSLITIPFPSLFF